MPELPEVEFAARVFERAARGKSIADLRLLHPALRRRVGDECVARLRGRRVERVERRGKHQLIVLDDGSVVHVHFRMAGDWAVATTADPDPPRARAVIDFADGTRVALVDPRALSTVTLHRPGSHTLPQLGPEATDPALDVAVLAGVLARRRMAIKPALLDQRVVAGLGNIYAAEALWHARIDPRATAASIGRPRLARLVDGMRQALATAADDPGHSRRAESTGRLRVYGREGEPCDRCGTAIRRIVQSGRSTYLCPSCQRH